MGDFSQSEIERLEGAGKLLDLAEKRLPVLTRLNWDRSLADRFFARGETEPPAPEYTPIAPEPSLELVAKARALIDGQSPVHDWLKRLADVFETTAYMMAHVGSADFHKYSTALYGGPGTMIGGRAEAGLGLARRLVEVLSEFDTGCGKLGARAMLSAGDLKRSLDAVLPDHFGVDAPEVRLSKNVSARAAAGADYIKLREDAMFSDLDQIQLLQHEAFIHIGTNLNGKAQTRFPILGESHPGNARTQEGLAVFAEYISGALDPMRLKRLANRVIAIHMAEEGADFIDIYSFFRERGVSEEPFEAFESARRVVRGGVVGGGAPFTKDSVYLAGLLNVHNYLRTAVRAGDADYIRMLFVGKIDLEDLEAIKMLKAHGLINEPRFVPPWVSDMRHLLSYLAYSTFLDEIKLDKFAPQYDALFAL